MAFLELRQEPGVYSRVTVGIAIQNSSLFSEVRILSSYQGHLRNLNKAWQDNTDASGGEVGTKGPFLVSKKILGFLSISKKSQASSPLKH